MTFTKDYYIGVFEWTTAQKGYVYGLLATPTDFSPESTVYQYFADRATKLREHTSIAFAVPTEAQWEYACRAGSVTPRFLVNGAEIANITTVACTYAYQNSYYGGAQNVQHPGYGCAVPCGRLTPNAWGFYDMYGNVSEWTATPYSATAFIIRGYDCAMSGEFDYSGARLYNPATTTSGRIGFRACCNVSGN